MNFEKMLPITRWSKNYSSSDLARDLIGGLQLSTILIPQAMSYSLIASLPPESGLYSVVISGIVHIIFGISPFESIGPFAVTSLIIGGALLTAANNLNQGLQSLGTLPHGAKFASLNSWIEFPIIIPLSELFTLLVSLTLLIIFVTNAGMLLSKFLPKELISGFTSAAAISIITSQLKQLLGIRTPNTNGIFINFKTFYYLFLQIREINFISLLLGIITILIILACEFIEANLTASFFRWTTSRNIENKTLLLKPGTIPTMLLSIVIPSIISYAADFPKRNVKIIGPVPNGLPKFNLPWRVLNMMPSSKMSVLFLDLVPNVLAVALVSYVALLSILQEFPITEDEIIDFDEIIPSTDESGVSELSQDPSEEAESNVSEEFDNNFTNNSSVILVATADRDSLSPDLRDNHREVNSPWSAENNELFCLVLANFFAPFASGYTVSPSLSRSAILATQLRTRSPLGNFTGCVMAMVTCFVLTDVIYHIPLSSLAGLVIISLKSTLFKIALGYSLYQKGGLEFKIWLITFLAVVIVDPASGILTGMITCAILKWLYGS